jgi:sugar phosphate isomerase/epimerase
MRTSGCAYIETGFLGVAQLEAARFAEAVEVLEGCGLRAEAMNGFLPGEFQLLQMDFGSRTQTAPLRAFLQKGFARAERVGCTVVAFGSAKARRRPEGMTREESFARLLPFLRLAGDLALAHGMRLAVEPLRSAECNTLNTVAEGLALVRAAAHPGVAVLADMYHMCENGEDFSVLRQADALLHHCHIGCPGTRKYPMPADGYDYKPFFAALQSIGYTGRISVEAGQINGPEDLGISIAYLRGLSGAEPGLQ